MGRTIKLSVLIISLALGSAFCSTMAIVAPYDTDHDDNIEPLFTKAESQFLAGAIALLLLIAAVYAGIRLWRHMKAPRMNTDAEDDESSDVFKLW